MKNKIKITMISFFLILSFIIVACSNKTQTNENNTNEREILAGNVYHYEDNECVLDLSCVANDKICEYQLTKSDLDYIHNQKNTSYEIPINTTGYSTDTLYSYIISSSVLVVYEDPQNVASYIYSSANIYDIDDKYIYIICSAHGIKVNGISKIENIKVQFVNKELARPIYLRESDVGDYALLVVDKNDISIDLLEVVHSINTENLYQTVTKDTTLYGCMNVACIYNEYMATIDRNLDGAYLLKNSNLVSGTSGGGMFDIYGNYYGLVKNGSSLISFFIFPNFYNYIVEFNPEYGEPIGEIITFD